MEAKARQLESLFDRNVCYQVPLFQRPYVWNKENWSFLWEDILDLLDKQMRRGEAHPHFLGAIVLEQLPHASGSIETRLVIDGQQRFTTIQTFLMAARNLASELGASKYASRFSGLVENDEDRIEKDHEQYKLWPTNSDREAFALVHAAKALAEVDAAVKTTPPLAESNIIGAYRYFHRQITEWLEGRLDDDDLGEGRIATKDVRIEALWQVVKGKLQLVVIDLDKDDETQVIFETLNARGTELLPADLIKNYLFRRATAEDEAVADKLYEKHWRRFETGFWREEVQQGRIRRPRIDVFINHYLTLMTLDEVRSAHLFNAFKAFAEQAKPVPGSRVPVPTTPGEHIAQLSRYATVFQAFSEPGKHEALALFLRRLEAVDTATVYPFLMYAYAELMPESQAEFDRILGVLEAFLMRRLITNYTGKNYNRLFVDLIKAIDKGNVVSAEAVGSYLAQGTGESTRFPSDEELRTALFTQGLYGRIAQYKVRAVLEALDAASHTSKSETLAMPANLTIEHVLPQKWETHWPLPDSAKVDPVIEQKAAARRTILLNTLGNLTLITGSLNPALSNSAWNTKRPELLKFSKLNLTQYFHGKEADEWDEAAIERRTEALFAQLVKIWPAAQVASPIPAESEA